MARPVNEQKSKELRDRIAEKTVILLYKKGYDNLSLNEIINELKIAKGTFYHYFNSKEDLLCYLVESMNKSIYPLVKKIVHNDELDAPGKLNKAFSSIKRYKVRNRKSVILLAREMFKKENFRLKQVMLDQSRALYSPLFAEIIRQGKKEGAFRVGNPDDTAELLFYLASSVGDAVAPFLFEEKFNIKNMAIFLRKAKAARDAIKRILGMRGGRLNIFDKTTLKKMFKN